MIYVNMICKDLIITSYIQPELFITKELDINLISLGLAFISL